jgi:hypothetical protein
MKVSTRMMIAFAIGLFVGSLAHARPVIIEETAVIPNPDPQLTSFGGTLGLDGDHAIIIGHTSLPPTDPFDNPDTLTRALLFRKVGDTWTFVRRLSESVESNEADAPNQYAVEMRNGIAALTMLNLRIFERHVSGDYVQSTLDYSFGIPTQYLDIDNGTILLGDGCWGGSILQKEPDNVWRAQARLFGDGCGDSDGANGGAVALGGAHAAVPSPYNGEELPAPAMNLFRYFGNNDWRQTQRIVAEEDHYLGNVAMTPDVLYVEDNPRYGTARYYRSNADQLWRPSGIRLRADGDHRVITSAPSGSNRRIGIGENFVLRNEWDHDRQAGVVQMFRYVETGVIEHVATLVASNGRSLGGHLAISGRRLLVGGGGGAHYFELPVAPRAPALVQDDFEGAADIHWGAMAGDPFAIAQSGNTHVFRVSGTAGEAATEVLEANWTNQSIQADVKPTAINGSDRWVGLYTRRTSPSNYYYVTLRSTGILQLKRMYGGSFGTLDSATVPFTLNRTYRLRLESVGTRHRVYVDGELVLDASDPDIESGRPGLIAYKAAADFDNVVVSASDVVTLWERTGERVCDFSCPLVEWETAGGEWSWQPDGSNEVFSQASLTVTARAPAGALTRNTDQIVETRARLRAYGTGHDPWFGVMARYRDANNYAYLSLRRSNTLALRKLANGHIVELGSVPMPVTPGTWYRLRLEAVGNRLRAFVNDRQVLEVVDPQPSAGQVGVLTHRTQADYDDFVAVRP